MQFLDIISVNIWDILISFANLLVMFLILKRVLFKPVQKMFDTRKQQVEGIYAEANENRSAAASMKKEYETKMASAREEADGLVAGSPVYFASPNGNLISFMDRLFYSTHFSKHMKVGAAVVSCRRGGNSASFDVLNKYFTISGMPVASSTYWNQVHGFTADDVKKDLEGLQTMRNLARNMSFMIRAFADAKEKYGYPEVESGTFTNFMDGK